MPNALTISEAHKKLKAKQLSSVELTQTCIEQIEKVDGKLNAVVFKNFEHALAAAKQADKTGKFTNPLTGIPYLTKDVYCEKGVPTTGCSNVLRDKNYVPPFNATTIERLNKAGAISLGKANTDEFTMGSSTESSCCGVTHNPWDQERVAGGSSGGSAAATAADECCFALGTDTGGSIRQPASFCNCTGMRSTYGRTSRYGVMSMASSLDTIGALTKSVEDYALVLNAIAGQDPLDGTTGNVAVPDYTKALTGDIKGLKIGLPKEYFIDGLDKDTEQTIKAAVKEMEKLGAKVQDVSLPMTKYAVTTYYIICPSEVSSNMARYDGIRYGHQAVTPSGVEGRSLVEYYFANRSSGFGDEVKRRIMIGTYALSAGYFDAYYRQAQKVRTLIKDEFDTAFKQVDVIISPVTPTPAFKVGAHTNDPVAMYLEDAFTVAQAMAGIPCMSVPCGFSTCQAEPRRSLPIGLQIMGPQWGEEIIFKAGFAYQQATDWHTKKPNLT